MDTPACYAVALGAHLVVAADEEAAVQLASSQPETVDAVVAFRSEDLLSYALRMNHSDAPSPASRFDFFDVSPGLMPTPASIMLW
jgi:hypothetical protein